MAKRNRTTTAKVIERRIKEGRGQGHFNLYKPWLTIHDVPSHGIVTRTLGWKSGRLHHFFSEHFELAHFFQMEWSMSITDLREQYPLLPLEKTLFIAEKLGIKHPTDPRTHHPIVMTTDQLLTVRAGEETVYEAHSIKPESKLKKRVLEKLEIERLFFKDARVKWRLITEKQINYDFVKNVNWLHSSKLLDDLPHISLSLIDNIESILFHALKNQSMPFAKITLQQDRKLDLPPGTCISIAKYLIANRIWKIDMTKLLEPTLQPIVVERGSKGGILSESLSEQYF
ncbi:TnsA endonuclease N-terminal domain-containing protein [Paenibacillus agricola]|uniref:Heteromeric transposase endonuclease subunit TnsA n=1 Tax=Paenibacillus agricola TaxID=2716264 RepID=A0ABX0J895_9BACL|nr:TnsA endonuclease N-terminal domain-containing protein [Paenibacillus agricola]NHN31615.1 heteromeric transposase endonuclease subunit TnsA [Paenibacillus agricola]